MGIFPRKFFRLNRRKRKSEPSDFSEEELDEEGMRDLEATLSENSGFIVLSGERLQRYQKRLAELEKVFRKTAVIPIERPLPLENSVPSIIPALMRSSQAETSSAGPSQAHDDASSWRQEMAEEPQSSSRSSMASSSSSLRSSRRVSDGTLVREPAIAEAVPMPNIRTSPTTTSALQSKEQMKEGLQELESVASSGQEIPAAILSSSVHGDSAMPDTATSVDTLLPFTDMNDWNQHRPLMSFSDYHTPLPMRVSPFIDLQTQKVASTHSDDADRSPCPRTPAKDRSSTDGLLFSADSFEMSLQNQPQSQQPQPSLQTQQQQEQPQPQSPQPSTTRSSSPEIPDYDSDGGNVLLSHLRENKKQRDRMFRVSRMSLAPTFPVNVWDDVAPTRLHAQLINIAMDQDYNLLPVMY